MDFISFRQSSAIGHASEISKKALRIGKTKKPEPIHKVIWFGLYCPTSALTTLAADVLRCLAEMKSERRLITVQAFFSASGRLQNSGCTNCEGA